jgi:hypothetical protein
MNNKNKKIIHCLKMLRLAFNCNLEAHKLSIKSQDCYYYWDHEWAGEYSSEKSLFYNKKASIMEKIIKYIKKYNLPIKYGINDWIAYFSYFGCQISFHTFRNEDWKWEVKAYNNLKSNWKTLNKKAKNYSWNWSNRKNDFFPKRLEKICQAS